MDQAEFTDSALVLIGHGSTLNAESAKPVYQHGAELRRRGQFAEVREAFWKQEPQVKPILDSLTVPRVFFVPIFISDGFFSEDIIPRALGFRKNEEGGLLRVQRKDLQTLVYCKAIGSHDSMTSVLLARARQVVEKSPFPRVPDPKETTLFICGHGTDQNENSRVAIERQVQLIRGLGLYAGVHAVFMEEEPRVQSCYETARTRNIIVVPFFISDGLHTQEDIPMMLGELERAVQQRLQTGLPTWRNPTERKSKLVWYSSSIGNEPHIPDVIVERVREAAKWI